MGVSYETAVAADLPQLVELLGLLFGEEAEFAPAAPKQRAALERILADPGIGHLYVARDGVAVLAMLSLLYTVSTAEGASAAWLEDFVVRPGYRGRGIGGALARHAIGRARAAGIARITLLTDAGNAGAQRLYRALGFGDSAMRPMRLKLR